MQRQIEIQSFFHNGDQHVCGHGNPHLRFDGVLRRAEESLDTQVLLDPFGFPRPIKSRLHLIYGQ